MRRRSQQAKTMQMDSKDAEIARKFPASSSKRLMPGSLSWYGFFFAALGLCAGCPAPSRSCFCLAWLLLHALLALALGFLHSRPRLNWSRSILGLGVAGFGVVAACEISRLLGVLASRLGPLAPRLPSHPRGPRAFSTGSPARSSP